MWITPRQVKLFRVMVKPSMEWRFSKRCWKSSVSSAEINCRLLSTQLSYWIA
ncbi:Uncharacterised protein [Vibrio cholerae]|nr:Uncharacterised protein [Vibrio cholerae]CSI56300.1 Uncharacterised protein [Vibrio cholerae]